MRPFRPTKGNRIIRNLRQWAMVMDLAIEIRIAAIRALMPEDDPPRRVLDVIRDWKASQW